MTSQEIAKDLAIELKEVFDKAAAFDRMEETFRKENHSARFCRFWSGNPNITRIEVIFNGLIKEEIERDGNK